MAWKPFGSAASSVIAEAGSREAAVDFDDRTEIACALIFGARFYREREVRWVCCDDTEESSRDQTGAWNFKVNAARAYLSTKGVFFDKQGNPVAHSTMQVECLKDVLSPLPYESR